MNGSFPARKLSRESIHVDFPSAGEGLFHHGGKSFATVGGGVRLAAGFFLEEPVAGEVSLDGGKAVSAVAGKESFVIHPPIVKPRV